MAKLPVVSSKDVCRVLERIGYEFDHQTGSHMIYRRNIPPHTHVSVPEKREMPRGTLRALVRRIDLSVDEFVELLKK